MPHDAQDDPTALLADLEAELARIADVERESLAPGIVRVGVSPRNAGALPVAWTYLGTEIVVEAGRHGGRWELSQTPHDVEFIKAVIRSIAAGRVRETFGPRRSRVVVTMEDGATVSETGYASLLPRPGWRRRGQTVVCERYLA